MAEVTKTLSGVWTVDQDQTPNPLMNDGFIFDIDEAMKDKVSGIYVNDKEGEPASRLVAAYFRNPPAELRDVSFPHILIDRLTYRPARDREQRSSNPYVDYLPKGYTAATDGRPLTTRDMPIPYDFIYQITSLSRSYRQDRQIQFAMLQNDRFPPRGAYLVVGNTQRQMFVSDDSPREDNTMLPQAGGTPKRQFRSIWTATVSAELFQRDLEAIAAVTSVNVGVVALESS